MRLLLISTAIVLLAPAATFAREAVDASTPSDLGVTLYRDADRGPDEAMNREWPRGFAMITETRTVTLPPGESTVRFSGVAEGMVAVSAIVTGLPGGTIEKNRNADLLSPAALVDGTLGNRVTVTRTNPATGVPVAENAIIRTRADGGLVLQTSSGFEAVRCSGLPEKLTFDHIPGGLSSQPVFSVDTRSDTGGTYTVQLTYLAWGFDWQANYVATLAAPGGGDSVNMKLMSWLTLLNDNGQSFENAELLVVAGTLNVVSDFQDLSDPPEARPLRLTCYPFGSTAAGSDEYYGYPPPPPPPPPPPMAPPLAAMARMSDQEVVVTAQRIAVKAEEEELGDLKLYRVPVPVTVSAKGMKQVAFLDQDDVSGRLFYKADCSPWSSSDSRAASMMLGTVNDREHGLGMALPMGPVVVFEPSAIGDQLVARKSLRDYAEGQDIELELAESSQVFAQCGPVGEFEPYDDAQHWTTLKATFTNANPAPIRLRVVLGYSGQWQLRGIRGTRVKDGQVIVEVDVPANGTRNLSWELRPPGAA